jgi:hypothetical protein
MGFFSHIFRSIVKVVHDVVHGVIHAVTSIVRSIVHITVDLIKKHLPQILFAVSTAGLALGAAAAIPLTNTLASLGVTNTALLTTSATIDASIASIAASYSAFLTAIHFSTMMKISSIAVMVSQSFRERMNEVYRRISEVSSALGYGPQFLNLAFRNARAIVLDASTALGRSYDLAEIGWLKDFTDFMGKFAAKAEQYRNNPVVLFDDIDEHFVRPAMQVKAKTHQRLLQTVDATINVVKKTVNETVRLRDDVRKFVSDLPVAIRKEVEPRVGRVLSIFDEFISDTYQPAIARLDRIIDVLAARQTHDATILSDIAYRITRPGDLLRSVDRLPDYERRRQEFKIAEVSSREYRREVLALERESRTLHKHLEAVRKALAEKIPPAKWAVKEVEVPAYPPMSPPEIRKTWFVGDY